MIRKFFVGAVFAASTALGGIASAATIDLAFIMDRSGSVNTQFPAAMDALGDALANALGPTIGTADTYRVSVVMFNDNATQVVAPTAITSAGILAGVVSTIKGVNSNGTGQTNYKAAFDLTKSLWENPSLGGLGDTSLINMMTDGRPNEPGTTAQARAAALASATALQGAGWDSLSFESVGNSAGNSLLANLCFGPGNAPNDGTLCPIYTSGAQIGDPSTTPFVLDLPNFAAYNAVIGQKVQKIVNPGVVPVPAALPLLAAGMGLFGFMGWRRKQSA